MLTRLDPNDIPWFGEPSGTGLYLVKAGQERTVVRVESVDGQLKVQWRGALVAQCEFQLEFADRISWQQYAPIIFPG
jgi:hypothetical protein